MAATSRASFRVIGVDPGLNLTGYGVVEWADGRARQLEAGVIRLPRGRGANQPARQEALLKGQEQ